jgi:hypothetical protein
MDFATTLFTDIWNTTLEPSNVELLSVYRLERLREYPGVPIRTFKDWYSHREWMREERKKHLRMVNNYRILDDIEQEENKKKG